MKKTAWIAILLAACVDTAGTPETAVQHRYAFVVPAIATGGPAADKPVLARAPISTSNEIAPDDACNLLPADGSCDGLCNPDILAAEIPKGVCADFVCTLTDGSIVRYGGCN